ncbi:MAG TPA: FxsA family protein [Casimicrobiaceae bacterium]|nr:FxsA family protein [Casimicrobiaceae bacterium]
MRFVVLGIVLALPVVDLWVTTRLARWSGVPLWMWLTASLAAGLLLLRHERSEFRAKTLAALSADRSLMRELLDSGRKVLAAILLIIPGVISDVLALLLLLLPINQHGFRPQPATAGRYGGGEVVEGEWRRE